MLDFVGMYTVKDWSKRITGLILIFVSWIFKALTSNSESKSFFSISSALSFKVLTATVVTSAEPVDIQLRLKTLKYLSIYMKLIYSNPSGYRVTSVTEFTSFKIFNIWINLIIFVN